MVRKLALIALCLVALCLSARTAQAQTAQFTLWVDWNGTNPSDVNHVWIEIWDLNHQNQLQIWVMGCEGDEDDPWFYVGAGVCQPGVDAI